MTASQQRARGMLLLVTGLVHATDVHASDAGQIGVLPYMAPSPELDAFVRDAGRRHRVVVLSPPNLAAQLGASTGVVVTGRKGLWRD